MISIDILKRNQIIMSGWVSRAVHFDHGPFFSLNESKLDFTPRDNHEKKGGKCILLLRRFYRVCHFIDTLQFYVWWLFHFYHLDYFGSRYFERNILWLGWSGWKQKVNNDKKFPRKGCSICKKVQ